MKTRASKGGTYSSGKYYKGGQFMRTRYPEQPLSAGKQKKQNAWWGLGDLIAIILTGDRDGLPIFVIFLLDLIGILALVIAAFFVLKYVLALALILIVLNKPSLLK